TPSLEKKSIMSVTTARAERTRECKGKLGQTRRRGLNETEPRTFRGLRPSPGGSHATVHDSGVPGDGDDDGFFRRPGQAPQRRPAEPVQPQPGPVEQGPDDPEGQPQGRCQAQRL